MSNKGSLWTIYAMALILSACSLIYELLIAQSLAMLAANTVVWYSVTVGVYLAAMGLGALLYDSRPPRDRWSGLFQVEIALSVVGALAAPIVHLAHAVHRYLYSNNYELSGTVMFFAASFVAIFVVGLLTGIELPLLIRLGNEASAERPVSNRVLGCDYLGALVAGVLFPLALVPYLELLTIGLVTANVNLFVAAFLVYRSSRTTTRLPRRTSACGALALVFVLSYMNLGAIEQYFLKKYYYYHEAADDLWRLLSPMSDLPDVFRASSPYQKIDIVHRGDVGIVINAYSTKYIEDPSQPENYYLFLNGDVQVASNYEEFYHEFFAHVPLIVHGKVPERVLVMGAGDGLLIRELLKYDQLKEITHVDLDRTLISLAKTHPILTKMNGHSLEDPRVSTTIADAYHYIRNRRERYEAIYLDFPYVKDYNLSKLYSREFFHFVREHLTEDGYAVLDAPESQLFIGPGGGTMDPESDWPFYYHTLKEAGFGAIMPYVSAREVDNLDAQQILRIYLQRRNLIGRAADSRILDYLNSYVAALRQGFILLRKQPTEAPPKYREFGIKLHALNEKRFKLAFKLPYPTADQVDFSKVNSIMRPTMPTISMWYTRAAW